MHYSALPRSFFAHPTQQVAPALLGAFLVRPLPGETRIGKIVETEAYVSQDDPAAHFARGLTPRTTVLFGTPGHAYIYRLHRYFGLNAVCEDSGTPGGVLIRAIEPVSGITLPTSGPGLLSLALDIDLSLYGTDLTNVSSPLFIAPSTTQPIISTSPRIGISKARDLHLRFFIPGNPYLSRP